MFFASGVFVACLFAREGIREFVGLCVRSVCCRLPVPAGDRTDAKSNDYMNDPTWVFEASARFPMAPEGTFSILYLLHWRKIFDVNRISQTMRGRLVPESKQLYLSLLPV